MGTLINNYCNEPLRAKDLVGSTDGRQYPDTQFSRDNTTREKELETDQTLCISESDTLADKGSTSKL